MFQSGLYLYGYFTPQKLFQIYFLTSCRHVSFPAPVIQAKVEVVSLSLVSLSALLSFTLRFQQFISVLLVWVSLLIYDLPNQMPLPDEQLMISLSVLCSVRYWKLFFCFFWGESCCQCVFWFWIVFLDVMFQKTRLLVALCSPLFERHFLVLDIQPHFPSVS